MPFCAPKRSRSARRTKRHFLCCFSVFFHHSLSSFFVTLGFPLVNLFHCYLGISGAYCIIT